MVFVVDVVNDVVFWIDTALPRNHPSRLVDQLGGNTLVADILHNPNGSPAPSTPHTQVSAAEYLTL